MDVFQATPVLVFVSSGPLTNAILKVQAHLFLVVWGRLTRFKP